MPVPRRAVLCLALLASTGTAIAHALPPRHLPHSAARHIAWDGMLLGTGTSKIRGLIEMVGGKKPGTTLVTVSFKGDVGGVSRPWHVHVGSCAKGGGVLGGAASYPPLKVSAAGVADGTATLAVTLPDSGSFYVNIHESAAKMNNVIACGDLLLAD